jgi:hypothetical protein
MGQLVRVLTFGDSLTAGYTGSYGARYHPYAGFIQTNRGLGVLTIQTGELLSYLNLNSTTGQEKI